MLIVAPMSGHYSTLLRGTVESMLPHYDVYITDWVDARTVPASHGAFDLDDYVDYVTEFLRHLGPGTSVMAVCQPSVPVIGGRFLDERCEGSLRAQDHDPDGRAHRHAPQPDGGEQARQGQGRRLVPQQRHHEGAGPSCRHDARRLSGLPAARRLHADEPRPPCRCPPRTVLAPRRGRWRFRRQAPRVLRRVHVGDGPHGRILPADG
jgi:hypothetical protein